MDNLPGRAVEPVETKPLTLSSLRGPALDEVDFPDVKLLKNGEVRVLATAENVAALLSSCGISVCWDVHHKRLRAINVRSVGHDENDYDMVRALLESEAARHGLPAVAVSRFLAPLARLSLSNPPLDYIKNLPAGGVSDPIGQLIEGAGLEPPEWARVALNRWLIQACAATDFCEHAVSGARPEYGYVLTLVGAQGIAKTSLLYHLIPEPIREYGSFGRTLDPSNKDSKIAATSNWLIELGELDSTFKKSDIAAMKAFLTDQCDEIRKPYAYEATRSARSTVFAATVNQPKFLVDDTGNRRFWPVTVTRRFEWPEGLAEGIWAKAWAMYTGGAQWWLTPGEEAMHAKVVYGFEDQPMRERLLDVYDFDATGRADWQTSTEILEEIGWPNTNRSGPTELGKQLKNLGIEKGKGRRYGMPPMRNPSATSLRL